MKRLVATSAFCFLLSAFACAQTFTRTIAFRGSVTAAGGGSGSDVTEGLLSKWLLDETSGSTAADAVGGFTLTSAGSLSWGAGHIGNCVTLSGSPYLYFYSSTNYDFTSESFSIALWMKPTALATSMVWHKNAYNASGYQVVLGADGALSCDTSQSGASQTSSTAANTIATNLWTHVCVTRSGATVVLYTNGVNATVTSGSHIDPVSNTIIAALGKVHNGGYAFTGSFDDVRIYNRALSQSEAAILAAQ